jgi:hypothetical protein
LIQRAPIPVLVASLALLAVIVGAAVVGVPGTSMPQSGNSAMVATRTGEGGMVTRTILTACSGTPGKHNPYESGQALQIDTVGASPSEVPQYNQTTTVVTEKIIQNGTTVTTTIGGVYGQVGPPGIVSLSNSSDLTSVHFDTHSLSAGFHDANQSAVAGCGVSYCTGAGCYPSVGLGTTLVNETSVLSKSFCTIEVCYSPGTSNYLSINATSPKLSQGVPSTYKFWIEDTRGEYVTWTLSLVYVGP